MLMEYWLEKWISEEPGMNVTAKERVCVTHWFRGISSRYFYYLIYIYTTYIATNRSVLCFYDSYSILTMHWRGWFSRWNSKSFWYLSWATVKPWLHCTYYGAPFNVILAHIPVHIYQHLFYYTNSLHQAWDDEMAPITDFITHLSFNGLLNDIFCDYMPLVEVNATKGFKPEATVNFALWHRRHRFCSLKA